MTVLMHIILNDVFSNLYVQHQVQHYCCVKCVTALLVECSIREYRVLESSLHSMVIFQLSVRVEEGIYL